MIQARDVTDNINGFGPFYEGSNPSEPTFKSRLINRFL